MPYPQRPPRRAAPLLSSLLLPLLLLAPAAACSDSGPTSPEASAPSVDSVEGSSFARINQSRRDDGKGELFLDPVLSEIARAHSRRMRDEAFFGHDDPSGNGLVQRLRAAGITFSLAGENLALVDGVSDPARAAHDMLMGNPAHRGNILDGRYTEAGIGVAQRGDSYWITQVFLRR